MIKIEIDRGKCTGCGLCVADCLRHVLEVQESKAVVLSDDCLKCGHCLAVCPANAVRMIGIEDEIIEKGESSGMLNSESLKAHLKLRRSVRQYQRKPVEREKLEKIIEAGRLIHAALRFYDRPVELFL
jgi:NAD-dependent dihydropyrimidine dehydrogenase PreA subunit